MEAVKKTTKKTKPYFELYRSGQVAYFNSARERDIARSWYDAGHADAHEELEPRWREAHDRLLAISEVVGGSGLDLLEEVKKLKAAASKPTDPFVGLVDAVVAELAARVSRKE